MKSPKNAVNPRIFAWLSSLISYRRDDDRLKQLLVVYVPILTTYRPFWPPWPRKWAVINLNPASVRPKSARAMSHEAQVSSGVVRAVIWCHPGAFYSILRHSIGKLLVWATARENASSTSTKTQGATESWKSGVNPRRSSSLHRLISYLSGHDVLHRLSTSFVLNLPRNRHFLELRRRISKHPEMHCPIICSKNRTKCPENVINLQHGCVPFDLEHFGRLFSACWCPCEGNDALKPRWQESSEFLTTCYTLQEGWLPYNKTTCNLDTTALLYTPRQFWPSVCRFCS